MAKFLMAMLPIVAAVASIFLKNYFDPGKSMASPPPCVNISKNQVEYQSIIIPGAVNCGTVIKVMSGK
jgi:hypothetical protein